MAVHAEGPLATSASVQLDLFFLQKRKTNQVNLQKDDIVLSTQKQLSCKKDCSPMQNKRSCEIQVCQPRNGGDGRSVTKIDSAEFFAESWAEATQIHLNCHY